MKFWVKSLQKSGGSEKKNFCLYTIAYSDALFLALQLLEVLLLLALSAAVSDSSSENTARLEES